MKNTYKVISLYCFIKIEKNEISYIQERLLNFQKQNITGLIILGEEGFNGTICGPKEKIELMLDLLKSIFNTSDFKEKISFSEKKIFKKLKIKIKPEIVTMGIKDINPNKKKGKYLDASNWNKLIEKENTLIIDTRNYYEVSLGTFKNAINPNTKNFREFPKWVSDKLDKTIKDKNNCNIAMFCTGGIRCEKATSLLLSKGYKNVFHLKGGILKYLETIESDKSLYEGECYVFDNRVSVNNKLNKGSYSICHACGMPLSLENKKRDEYIEGIQCHFCINKFSDLDRERFAERQKQFSKRDKII